jgi:hypothetical protein
VRAGRDDRAREPLRGEAYLRQQDEAALVARIDELEEIVRGFLRATDGLTHLEGAPRAIADLSAFRVRARALLRRSEGAAEEGLRNDPARRAGRTVSGRGR